MPDQLQLGNLLFEPLAPCVCLGDIFEFIHYMYMLYLFSLRIVMNRVARSSPSFWASSTTRQRLRV